MKFFITSALAFFMSAAAFGQDFLPPYAETPFSTGVRDRSTNQPLPDGNWAFNVTIRNPNPREVYCKNTAFIARLSTFEEACTKADYATYVRAAGDLAGFTIPANGNVNYPEAGYPERLLKKAEMGTEVVFCGRDGWNLECGYICEGGRNPGDGWTENGDWGHVKKACNRLGQTVVEEVRCSSENYTVNSEGNMCIPRSCGSHAHNSRWDFPIENGKQVRSCKFGVDSVEETVCDPSFNLVGFNCQAQPATIKVRSGELTGQCGQLSTERDVFKGYAPFKESQIYGRNGSRWEPIAPSCTGREYLLAFDYYKFPARGQVKVRFHIALNLNGTTADLDAMSKDEPLAYFDFITPEPRVVWDTAEIRVRDMTGTLFENAEYSDIDSLGSLPQASLNRGLYSWRVIELTAYVNQSQYIEPRIKVLNPKVSMRVAGVDIQYFP